ncbi:hypothetical protein AB3S75_015776 [Citrus x aurantiifolia]
MGCKNLRMLLLCKNFFHEAIPDENQITISSYAFQNLVVLGIGDCEIKGQIPTWLGKLKKLTDLSYNSISGEFPKEFCGLPALAFQEAKNRADGNQLQLPLFVPETKCALYNQQYNKLFSLPPAIYLRNNGLNGSIPIEIGNVMFLHVFDLSLNNFSGEIPDQIFQLTKLEELDFSENNLHGEIPLSLVDLHFLSSFSVANNDLQGQYHQEVSFIRFQAPALKGIQDCVVILYRDTIHVILFIQELMCGIGQMNHQTTMDSSLWHYCWSCFGFIIGSVGGMLYPLHRLSFCNISALADAMCTD